MDFARSDACVVVPFCAIGKGEGDLGHLGLLVGLAPTRRPVAGYMRPACLASVVWLVNIAVGRGGAACEMGRCPFLGGAVP